MTTPYQPLDFYQIEELLTDEEKSIRDLVREYMDREFMPIIENHYEKGTFPVDKIPVLARLGVFGPMLKDYGCPGVSPVAYGLMMQELERCDSSLRSFASVQSALVMFAIHSYGSDEQKQKWLPALAKGEKIGCFGLTEHEHGSDPSGMTTRAVKKGKNYVVNGAKMWITNGTIADVAVVWAYREGEVCGFLVEKGTRGFSSSDIPRKHSLRASVTSELVFDQCEIPKENRMPKAEGLTAALRCLTEARYGIAWGAVGAAQACFDVALQYSKSREQFGRPIAAFQLTQEKLADMATEITKAQLLAFRLAKLKEAGKAHFTQVSMAKRNNVAMALQVARQARTILGASGVVGDYPLMRHMANLESVLTYEGTHEIHTLILGEKLTGIPAYGNK